MFESFFKDVFSEEHNVFRQSIRKFVREEIAPHAYEWEEAEIFPRELYSKAGEIGFLGATFPSQYGGADGDPLMQLAITEEMMKCGSTGVVVGLGSHSIGLPPLLSVGSEQQRQEWIPPVLAGKKVAALAVTEPGTGSDVAGVRTTAKRDGDGWRINGSKMFITSGTRADVITTLCRTGDDPHGGLTFFILTPDMEGFHVSRSLKKTGWRASDTAELSFDNVYVPDSHRVGELGSGFIAVMQNFQNERLYLATIGYASAERALELAMDYVKEREAFGRTVAKFQVTKHKLAEMGTKVLAAKALTYQVAQKMAAGEMTLQEVSMAKNLASDVAQEVCWQACQLMGGMGYMRESEAERLYRDVRLLPIGGGTREIMHEIIAKTMGL